MIPFFYLFHISGAGKHLRAKELKLKMSGGGKSCSQECVWVENSWCSKITSENTLWWKVPCGGKYLAVENVWPSKKLQPLSESEEKHHLHRPQPIQLLVRGGGGGK